MSRPLQIFSFLKISGLVSLLFICYFANGQVLSTHKPADRSSYLLNELYYQGHYGTTTQLERQYLATDRNGSSTLLPTETEFGRYYLTQSYIKTELRGWQDSALNSCAATPFPVLSQRMSFFLAQSYFRHNKLTNAIPYYEFAGIGSLSNAEIADGKFEMAYCYFNSKQFDKATPLFSSIKEIADGKYYKAGNYYYGLLAYNESKFGDALTSFNTIKNDRQYRSVVPYYIAETYYFMGDRNNALNEAIATTGNKSEKSYYDNELNLLIAQCYFEDQKYAEARPYFETYYKNADKIRKEDLYKIAYCYYRTNDWSEAIEKFKLLSGANDSLGQTSMYLLGDCYLKTSDKKSARNAYSLCADMPYNLGQQEASMMLYAMISYEMGYDDEASRQLKNLLQTFPQTTYRDEANKLISDLLLKTHKYGEALTHLDRVKRKDDAFRRAYQQATYGNAVELFRAGDFSGAYKYFGLSHLHHFDDSYEAAAYFWKGEIAYRMHNYDDAISNTEQFLSRKSENISKSLEKISPQATMQHAYLTMGFASMALQEYKDAQDFFNLAQQISHGDNMSYSAACVHEADAVFMQKNYSKAIALYNKIITNDSENADYARYQKAIISGLVGKNNEKINLLQAIVSDVPQSGYAATALYELGNTYLDINKLPQALDCFIQLSDPATYGTIYGARAWMKIGFIYQHNKDFEKSVAAYKHVLIEFPASEERLSALDILKSLYIQNNEPSLLERLLRENKLPGADSISLDSTYYAAAELQYSSGEWVAGAQAFNEYLGRFPRGVFALKAHYYRAECLYQQKKFEQALVDYKVVIDGKWNDFSENCAIHGAKSAAEQKYFATAKKFYEKLKDNRRTAANLELAFTGLMNYNYAEEKIDSAAIWADSLLGIPTLTSENAGKAMLCKANCRQKQNKQEEAFAIFKQLTGNKNGEIAAESRYHIAEIYYRQDSLQKAESAANDVIRLSPGYDYWVVKSYILIADLFIKQQDYFNAKATLESIVQHTRIAELKQEAQTKLDSVNTAEKQKSKLKD